MTSLFESPTQIGPWAVLAFAYWLIFLSVLEPGNVRNVLNAGLTVDWRHEAFRLIGAATLGASAMPLLLELGRRFPIQSHRGLAHSIAQGLGALCLGPSLILLSCLLAAWSFSGTLLPSLTEIRNQLEVNTTLVVFCLVGLQALIHFVGRPASASADEQDLENGRSWLKRLTISERGQLTLLDLTTVDWIETQGNYQALHVSDHTHLIRETSVRFAAKLDPVDFIRIHRRMIVAVSRIIQLKPLPNGDALVCLNTGTELRVSRGYRKSLIASIQRAGGHSATDPNPSDRGRRIESSGLSRL